MNIDLARFPTLGELVSSSLDRWSDSDVPLPQRGVSLPWLLGVLRNLLEDINRPHVDAIHRMTAPPRQLASLSFDGAVIGDLSVKNYLP